MASYRQISALIPREIPAIIESMVSPDEFDHEVQIALASLGDQLPESVPRGLRIAVG
jgi:hypothetical protein